ncbi:hypothetical protein HY450_02175 [Candidatus Pacearchaeota archaeon]|nr:hypothetical protein [Candidatus Pacearchaeota archaeon]
MIKTNTFNLEEGKTYEVWDNERNSEVEAKYLGNSEAHNVFELITQQEKAYLLFNRRTTAISGGRKIFTSRPLEADFPIRIERDKKEKFKKRLKDLKNPSLHEMEKRRQEQIYKTLEEVGVLI